MQVMALRRCRVAWNLPQNATADPMSLGKEADRRRLAPARTGVGGGKAAWMKVFCTMNPKLSNVDGVNGLGAHATPILPELSHASDPEQTASDVAGGFNRAASPFTEEPSVAHLLLTRPSSFGSKGWLFMGDGDCVLLRMLLAYSASISSMHNGATRRARPLAELLVLTDAPTEKLVA